MRTTGGPSISTRAGTGGDLQWRAIGLFAAASHLSPGAMAACVAWLAWLAWPACIAGSRPAGRRDEGRGERGEEQRALADPGRAGQAAGQYESLGFGV